MNLYSIYVLMPRNKIGCVPRNLLLNGANIGVPGMGTKDARTKAVLSKTRDMGVDPSSCRNVRDARCVV
jgi:hypothetical protein